MTEVDTENQITIGTEKKPISEIAKHVGYKNSGVLCWNLDKLIGVISHGRIDQAISPEDALQVADYLVAHKQAVEIQSADGTEKGWNIFRNEEASNLERKTK